MFSPLHIKVSLKIAKTPGQVFEAIADPVQLSHYFIATSTGRMQTGASLAWTFPEFDASFRVEIGEVISTERINFKWQHPDGTWTDVQISVRAMDEAETFVTITEGTKEPTEANLAWLKSNTEGWANFLCCLKAWLEYGINLRKGAFDISQMPVTTD